MAFNDLVTDTAYKLIVPFNEGSGSSATDYSSFGHASTFVNSPPYATGPNAGWLSSAIDLNGAIDERQVTFADSDDYVMSSSFTLSMWVKLEGTNFYGILGKCSAFNRGEWYIYVSNRGIYFRIIDDSTAGVVGRYTFPALTIGVWHKLVCVNSNNALLIYVDGIRRDFANTSSGTFVAVENTATQIEVGTRHGEYFAAADIANVVVVDGLPSLTTLEELDYGPEPLNTVVPTLTIDASSWSGTVGSWDSQGNGTVTYAWELRDADDDSVVESGTGSSPSGSGSYSGSYYLWVRASNFGGYDTNEDSVSLDQLVEAGAAISSRSGLAYADIASISGVAIADIAAISGVTL